MQQNVLLGESRRLEDYVGNIEYCSASRLGGSVLACGLGPRRVNEMASKGALGGRRFENMFLAALWFALVREGVMILK
jgi:hypothetical protein